MERATFDNLVREVYEILKNGRIRRQTGWRELSSKEVLLQGKRAEELGYRVREALSKEGRIVQVDENEEIPESDGVIILYIDSRNFPGASEEIRDMVRGEERRKILVIDEERRWYLAKDLGFSYSIDLDQL